MGEIDRDVCHYYTDTNIKYYTTGASWIGKGMDSCHYNLNIRVPLRLEFQIAHSTLSTNLVTHE